VRANKMPSSLSCAPELQTFRPSTTTRRRARHGAQPCEIGAAPGSLNSWHQTSSPRSARQVPLLRLGAVRDQRRPDHLMPTANAPASTSKCACS
jgi:hypothetical protein